MRRDGILIDPGHDFGKNTRHSLEITRRLGEMTATDWPVLVAMSNKDFLGEALDLDLGRAAGGRRSPSPRSRRGWAPAMVRAHAVRPTRRVLDTVRRGARASRPPVVARRGLA